MTLRVLQSDALTDSFIQSLSTVRLSLILELGRLETETLLGDACKGVSLTILATFFSSFLRMGVGTWMFILLFVKLCL